MASSLSPDIRALLTPISKFKLRSHETSLTSHIPLLKSSPSPGPPGGPSLILLGDSMLERLITTCHSPNDLTAPEPWPSPTLLPTLPSGHSSRLPPGHILNCGVGGDKIQNVAYRLLGDAEKELPSLAEEIAKLNSVKVWLIHAGTNNLTSKRGLSDSDAEALRVLVKAVLKVQEAPGGIKKTRVIVTGLFYRKDVPDEKVDEANKKIQNVVGRLNDEEEVGHGGDDGLAGEGRVSWLDPPPGIKKEEHLDDHVHLNLEGYRIWVGEVMYPAVSKVLREVEEEKV
ncbi:SGNH hydrolase-type esterase domain-containing protein [Cladorrhinum sp. PSN259]|nr:SGNH hydrolase-type esterase domain-containing protein [Cladorrhinum sp. PSN259]